MNSLPVITVRGSAMVRGEQAGERLKSSLEAVMSAYEVRLQEWCALPKESNQIEQDVLGRLQEFCPEMVDYLKGVARGSKQPLGRLLTAITAYDLWTPPRSKKSCTSIAWRSAEGDVWAAQTFDWFSDLKGHIVVLREINESGSTIRIGLAEAALPWLTSMNNYGVAVLVNALTGYSGDDAIPARGHVLLASSSKSVPGWRDKLEKVRAVSPLHLLCAAGSGEILGAEIDPEITLLCEAESGILVHTNHFIYPGASEGVEAMLPSDLDESAARHRLAREKAAVYLKEIDNPLSAFKQIFASHDPTRYPRTLCCHPTDEFGPLARAETLAAVVFHPKSLRTWVCAGNACSGEFVSVPWEAIS